MAVALGRVARLLAGLQGLIQGLLEGLALSHRHRAAEHALKQAGRLRQLGIEELFDLMLGIAVALVGNRTHRQAEQAEYQQQGTCTDRAHQALSTR
jgi:hypothetical protein